MVLVERASLPPPLSLTSNTLTRAEREQRRRSANKVGRVLGITPQVMDLGSATLTDHYWSMTTAVISSHVSLPALPYSTPTEFEHEQHPYNDDIFIRGGESKRTMKSTGMDRPLLLRRSPPLPAARSTHFHPLSKFKTHYIDPDAPANLGEADDDSLPELSTSSSSEGYDISDPPSPTLSTVSRIAVRRKKMDRLQRTLGDDVPVNMVFPENPEDTSGLARDVDASVQTPSRTLRSTRNTRPQSAPAGSARFFSTDTLEESLARTRTNTPAPQTDEQSGQRLISGKSETSLAQETSHPRVLKKTRRKRPITSHPDHRPRSFFHNSKPLELEKPAVSPAPVSQKTPGRKKPAISSPHYRPKSYFQTNNQTQLATAAKYSYIYYPTLSSSTSNLSCEDGKSEPIMEFGEAKCLRTIVESPDELANILAQDSGRLCRDEGHEDRSLSLTNSSNVSLSSNWDSLSTAIHARDQSGAAGAKPDEKREPDAESGTAKPAMRVWRHKRKPPPVYDPLIIEDNNF